MNFSIVTDQENLSRAEIYAQKYTLPIATEAKDKDKVYIIFLGSDILLQFFNEQGIKQEISVDFGKKLTLNRYRSFAKENIVKAIGKVPKDYQLYDLTAGFAKDSLLLAAYGYKINLIEKHPIIYAITAHAIDNLHKHNLAMQEIAARMSIMHQDSYDSLANLPLGNYIFYLDPMFPKISKAKVKKEMQLMQKINPPQFDIADLLHKAIEKGKKVIVKRNKDAKKIGDFVPHHIIMGTKIKFEIYYDHAN